MTGPDLAPALDLEISRADLHTTRVVERDPAALAPGQARLRIERFGLSANNITYAVIGDMLQYWAFFPAADGWGRVPVWGYAEVVESTHDELDPGRRVFGFLPMSSELVVDVGRVDDGGFTDVAEHRRPMAGAYNRYAFADPDIAPGSADEERRMLLYPLFFTAFLVDDFIGDNGCFDATTLVISSASSKTGLGIARQAAVREDLTVIGLTSPANVAFTEGLGAYDIVLPYGRETDLPVEPTIYVDVSGAAPVRNAVHHHLGDALRHDMVLGATHWAEMGGAEADLPGAAPAFFFAPSQIAKRVAEWGQERLDSALAEAWAAYAPWVASWIEVRHATSFEELAETWCELLDNQADPAVGHIIAPGATD